MFYRHNVDIINALNLEIHHGGCLMKKLIMMSTGFLVLASAMVLAGCAPLPNRDHCEYGVEIVYVPVPVPYPDPYPVPDYIREPAPPPPRRVPLVRPPDSVGDTPRTKNPTGDRPSRKPVGMRGRGGSDRPPEQIASSTPKRPLLKRR